MVQDPAAPVEWPAAATALLVDLAVLEPEAVQQKLAESWIVLAVLVASDEPATCTSALQNSLHELGMLVGIPIGEPCTWSIHIATVGILIACLYRTGQPEWSKNEKFASLCSYNESFCHTQRGKQVDHTLHWA